MSSEITNAPKAALGFVKGKMWAFAFLAFVLLLAFVAYEVRNPGKIRDKVSKLPLVGKPVTTPKA